MKHINVDNISGFHFQLDVYSYERRDLAFRYGECSACNKTGNVRIKQYWSAFA